MLNVKKQEMSAAIGAIVGGICSQGMGLTNKYAFSDDVNLMFSSGATVSSGRGGLLIFRWIESLMFGNGQYSLPLYNGIIAILAIAITVAIMIRLFEIKNPYLSVLIGGIFGAFPPLTALMFYDFTVHYYMLGLLVGTWSTFIALRGKKTGVRMLGILGIGMGVGVYQAFLPVFTSMVLLVIINDLGKLRNASMKELLQEVLKKAIVIPLSLLVYYLLNAVLIKIVREEYSGYMGIGSEFSVSPREYVLRTAVAIREFFYPSKEGYGVIYTGNSRYFYIGLVVLLIGLGIWRYSMCRKNMSIVQRLFLIACCACIPVSVNLIYVLSSYRIVRMEYSMVMFFMFLGFAVDQLIDKQGKWASVSKPLVTAGLILICLNFARTDNISYLKATLIQSEAIQYFNALIAKIQTAEGYNKDYPVAFVNESNKDTLHLIEFTEFAGLPEDPDRDLADYVNDFMWYKFMGIWCGYEPQVVSEKQYENSVEVSNMPSYPDDGSVKVINQTVVVKF